MQKPKIPSARTSQEKIKQASTSAENYNHSLTA